MAGHNIAPIPRDTAIARAPREKDDKLQGFPTDIWADYLERANEVHNRKPTEVFRKILEQQSASIAATDITDGTVTAGLYLIAYYVRITRAASTSSSLAVEWTWTDTVAQTETYAAVTGNTTATHDWKLALVYVDKNSPIRYALTYASVGATTMQYDFKAVVLAVLA